MQENYLFRAWIDGQLVAEQWHTMKDAIKRLERFQVIAKGKRRVRIHYLDQDGQLQLVEDWQNA